MKESFVEMLRRNQKHVENFEDELPEHGDGQSPAVVTVSCSDSRVLHDHALGNSSPGELFTVGNIGNRVFQESGGEKFVSGDMIYPVSHTGTNTMVVMGHTGCGAVTATYRTVKGDLDYDEEERGIQRCIDLLKPYIREGMEKLPEGLGKEEAVNYLVEYNVDRQVEFLRSSEEVPEEVEVVGAVYDLHNVYKGKHGSIKVINVNGVTSIEKLKQENPEVSDRFERIWSY